MTTLAAMASRKTHNPTGNPVTDDDLAFSEDFARRVKTECEQQGRTFRDIERAIGAADGAVAQLVSGRRAGATTLKLAWKIAKALGESLDFLCDGKSIHRGASLSAGASQGALKLEPPPKAPSRSSPRPASRKKKPQH